MPATDSAYSPKRGNYDLVPTFLSKSMDIVSLSMDFIELQGAA